MKDILIKCPTCGADVEISSGKCPVCGKEWTRDSLTDVTISDKVKAIKDCALTYCNSVNSLTILNGVKSIDKMALIKLDIKELVIPDSVKSIGSWAFYGCASLTNIVIPDSVKVIGNRAFGNCSSLTSITIPSGVKKIRFGTFYGCSSLTNVVIPEGVKVICEGAFKDCPSLTSIRIPNSVKAIGLSSIDKNCTVYTANEHVIKKCNLIGIPVVKE